MPLPLAVQAGKQALGRTGQGVLRGSNTGEATISKLLPDYMQAGLDGDCYVGANQAAQAVSVALATTYTGLALYNPIGSGMILGVKLIKVALAAAPAAIAAIGLISAFQTAAPTGLTTVPVLNSQIGNSKTGVGLLYAAATIATPVWRQMLIDGFTAAALYAGTPPTDIKGDIQILPGGLLAIGAQSAISAFMSFSWHEVPLTA